MCTKTVLLGTLLLTAGTASAQVTMDSLWPNQDGTRWEYEYTVVDNEGLDFTSPALLQLEGTVMTPGGPAQLLQAEHGPVPGKAGGGLPDLPPLLSAIWRARPDLRDAIDQRYGQAHKDAYWWPLFLHQGFFMKTTADIQMWQEDWNHPTWIYLEDDITVGATYVFQLVPELADDIFLHGSVAGINVSVETVAGLFSDAVKMEYLIDYGISVITDENGDHLGTTHGESDGHVYYVPEVGPVDMLEEFIPYVWLDCGENDCPPELEELLGVIVQAQTLSLTQLPVGTVASTWGSVKSLYR